ncbi:MAG: PGPGW domain-containing protein [Planctomycetota bacterium]
MSRLKRAIRKVIVLIVGGVLTLGGLIMLPLPPPLAFGWLLIPAGLMLLATEFVFARRWLAWLKTRTGPLGRGIEVIERKARSWRDRVRVASRRSGGGVVAALLSRNIRRFTVLIVGMTTALAGLLIVLTPIIPVGAFLLPLGLAILASEFEFAQRWLRALKTRTGPIGRFIDDLEQRSGKLIVRLFPKRRVETVGANTQLETGEPPGEGPARLAPPLGGDPGSATPSA